MRFARVVSAFDHRAPGVNQLVETADLDVLQLDYQWPGMVPLESSVWQSYAPGVLDQLRTLHKMLYLEPRLHVLTNAGGGNTVGCVEAIAEYLCEHGDANFLLTAIRGDNVLARLEELEAEGVELRELSTGKSIQAMTRPLLAAQVELGAGPIATALDEGSRFVVVGSYDSAAPVLGAAVNFLPLSWDDSDLLAPIATAANLAGVIVDVEHEGNVLLSPQAGTTIDPAQLCRCLQESSGTTSQLMQADICCEIENLKLSEKVSGKFKIAGVTGQAAAGQWLLRLTYDAGYFSEVLFECCSTFWEKKFRQSLAKDVQFETLRNPQQPDRFFLRVTCRSNQQSVCEQFVRDVARLSVQFSLHRDSPLASVPSRVFRKVESCWCPVPRDAISVSVDTRPAKEW